MSSQVFRLADGGRRISRDSPLTVTFDGRRLSGYAGDTLASVLMAHGVRTCSRGIYSGRPRGLMSAGAEESNVFIQVRSGCGEPMRRATEVEAYDGLVATALAGKGQLPDARDTSRYDKTFAHVETLVVGGGRSGCAAALKAAAGGGRVLLVHDQPLLPDETVAARLAEARNVQVLTRTTVAGLYDAGYVVAVERRTDHLADQSGPEARQRLWNVRATSVVLATGALERPIAFPGNDVPGVMLASSSAAYVSEFGVLPGRRAVVFGCHDGALLSALALADAGVEVAAVIDWRHEPSVAAHRLTEQEIPVHAGATVTATFTDASGALSGVSVRLATGVTERIGADLLAVSGGWNPTLQLYTTARGRTRWSPAAAAFVPDRGPDWLTVAGRARGGWLEHCQPQVCFVAADDDPDTTFLDAQRDATLADLRRATAAGLRSPEHVKRYTTIATAADQGRTSSVLSLGALAQDLGIAMETTATTTYRPPYTPISFAVLAGRDRGRLADPERLSPIHDWHVAAGAVFEDVGQWKRPWYFPAVDGEGLPQAVRRECAAVRTAVGMMDASTLGKIELQGSDVGQFLDRIYTNLMSTLPPGRIRYGVMCGLDGMVLDDGTVARLDAHRWLATTTTGNAAKVLDWMEEWLQTEWPDLDVRCTSVTEQWATIAVAGPRSRDVMATVTMDLDVSNEAFGFMEWREASIRGCPARIMRISFSGELAYEVNVSGWHGQAVWEDIYAAGRRFGIAPYGTETMHVLRAEKGYPIVGQDTDGTVTPQDLGMGWLVSKKKADFIGKRSFSRPDTARAGRRQLVGLVPVDSCSSLVEGAQLVEAGVALDMVPVPMVGHVTSAYDSVALGTPFALALLEGGASRHGEELQAVDAMRGTAVRVTAPVLFDPEGLRRDGD